MNIMWQKRLGVRFSVVFPDGNAGRSAGFMTMESSPGVLSIAGFSGAAEIKNTTGPKMGKDP